MNQHENSPPSEHPAQLFRIRAAGLLGLGVDILPEAGVVVLAQLEPGPNPRAWIVSVRPTDDADDSWSAGHEAIPIDRPGAVLMPALINAHAHLDLTHMGPCPADPMEPGSPASSFAAFGAHVLASRLDHAEALLASAAEGASRSLAGGVAVVGDIAGVWRTEPLDAMRAAGLKGTAYLEVFGQGDRVSESAQRMQQIVEQVAAANALDAAGCKLGLSPHAPYSASRRLYQACAALAETHGLRITTHLAECPEERAFIANATGSIRELLERLGGIDAATEQEFSHNETPIAHLKGVLDERFTVVHVNDCDDAGLDQLAASNATVVYCPRASAYFAHERNFGPHRYQAMLQRGIPVAIGTDSIICLPESQADRISPLDDARLLYLRDGTAPSLLMRMLYEHGAHAMGVPAGRVELPGVGFDAESSHAAPAWELLGLIAVDVQHGAGTTAGQRVLSAESVPERLTAESR